jgi:sodium-dependent dicarboxylate transporter 2/3/5
MSFGVPKFGSIMSLEKPNKKLIYRKIIQGVICSLIALAVYLILPAEEKIQRISGIFVFAALFWALEIIPLYGTSLLVVLLQIFTLCKPGGILNMDVNGYKMFLVPFSSPVIILFFGGFILASAMSKYHIDRIIARTLIRMLGDSPIRLMLGMMFTTAFLSMWMSNTATTAMMIAMLAPLLKQMDSSNPFRAGLILAIPIGANLGGFGTPVGTPPNAIALGILSDAGIHLTFLHWMTFAIPLVLILLCVAGALLWFMFPSTEKTIRLEVEEKFHMGKRARLTLAISLGTIVFWLTSGFHHIPEALVGLLAAGLFIATGLLNKNDVKGIDWDILLLMWGGLALGKGMEVTGFTQWIVSFPIFENSGFTLYVLLCTMALLLSTMMSNTATANLIIPIVISIPGESAAMLAVTVALACSFAMALPVSTPPNAIAFSSNIIKAKDLFKVGGLLSIISLVILLAGYRMVLGKILGM